MTNDLRYQIDNLLDQLPTSGLQIVADMLNQLLTVKKPLCLKPGTREPSFDPVEFIVPDGQDFVAFSGGDVLVCDPEHAIPVHSLVKTARQTEREGLVDKWVVLTLRLTGDIIILRLDGCGSKFLYGRGWLPEKRKIVTLKVFRYMLDRLYRVTSFRRNCDPDWQNDTAFIDALRASGVEV